MLHIALDRTAPVLAISMVLAGCAPHRQSAAAPHSEAVAVPVSPVPKTVPDSALSWLTVDSAARIATLALEVKSGAGGPVINGSRGGATRIIVPLGWTVRWSWRNADTVPHSLEVMVQREKIPLEGGRPAFSNAMTRMVSEGLPGGGTDQTTFAAEEAGWYWLMCGVPGHALEGEWLELRVDPEARTAKVVHR